MKMISTILIMLFYINLHSAPLHAVELKYLQFKLLMAQPTLG